MGAGARAIRAGPGREAEGPRDAAGEQCASRVAFARVSPPRTARAHAAHSTQGCECEVRVAVGPTGGGGAFMCPGTQPMPPCTMCKVNVELIKFSDGSELVKIVEGVDRDAG